MKIHLIKAVIIFLFFELTLCGNVKYSLGNGCLTIYEWGYSGYDSNLFGVEFNIDINNIISYVYGKNNIHINIKSDLCDFGNIGICFDSNNKISVAKFGKNTYNISFDSYPLIDYKNDKLNIKFNNYLTISILRFLCNR